MQKLLSAFLFLICSCVFCLAQDSPPKPTPTPSQPANLKGIRILSKPGATYTQTARINEVEGAVRVRVTFLASGEIGAVTPISGLAYGLTEQAMAAARQIRFEPATRDGIPFSVTKTLEYSFFIYYREGDEDLAKNAAILVMPAPEHPQKSDLRKIGGKVKLRIVLQSDESIRVLEVSTDLPKEFADAARKAASKIRFDAAIHKNGDAVTQSKVIEYEFKPQND